MIHLPRVLLCAIRWSLTVTQFRQMRLGIAMRCLRGFEAVPSTRHRPTTGDLSKPLAAATASGAH